MTGTTLDLDKIMAPEDMACQISDMFVQWDSLRVNQVQKWKEVQEYVFATSTKDTQNSKNEWSNSTTLPKLCQIRDNLGANYSAAMFPHSKWLTWEGNRTEDETVNKKQAIESYMSWVVDRNEFYSVMDRLKNDYIDYGNVFATVEWRDGRVVNNSAAQLNDPASKLIQHGYVGPAIVRIAPEDIVFNPTAPDFISSPKIIRSLMSTGEAKKYIDKEGAEMDLKEDAAKLWDYLKEVRNAKGTDFSGSSILKDRIYNIAGFGNFRDYLRSNMVEILTFYGDIYDNESDKLYENYIIKIVDRHKIISKRPSPSYFGHPPIYHAGWRIRPNSLWAMGPLENLIGMQYRIDHLENMKADVFDLVAYPPIKVTGYVPDFKWGPMERIEVGDDGDVVLLSPDVQALQADNQIYLLEQKMEEMAGSPKEAAGFRTPGEKTKYEVQRLENAASRIFQAKINQFERDFTENLINAMLESARRNMNESTIRVFNDQLGVASFMTLTPQDITGQGRIKPIAARHFAEQATLVQNINQFFGSALGQSPDVKVHWSGIKISEMMEELLGVEKYELVSPFVALSEQADAQKLSMVHQEDTVSTFQTPGGISQDDFDV